MQQLLKAADISELVIETHQRGDSRRGAILFYRSAAACANCHASGDGPSPLGPNLAKLQNGIDSAKLTDEYLIEWLMLPSKDIRKGFETGKVLTEDGTVFARLIRGTCDRLSIRRPIRHS